VSKNAVLMFLIASVLTIGVIVGVAGAMWTHLATGDRVVIAGLWASLGGYVVITLAYLLVLIGFGTNWIFTRYIHPLGALAEDARVIAVTNPAHRPSMQGPTEIRNLIGGLNVLAERYERSRRDFDDRIREAGAALEDEKHTLSALMSKISQGILVCNLDGRILLYNHQAQRMLEGTIRSTGGADWIGLGRPVQGVLDEHQINHALMTLMHGRQRGETEAMVPFVATRGGGQVLNVHLVPISGKERLWHGYILTLDDITHRIARESTRASRLQSLIEKQRSAAAAIRGAIETIMEYPDIDNRSLRQFHRAIHEESLKMADLFAALEDPSSAHQEGKWPLQDALASDLVAAIQRHVHGLLNVEIQVSVPIEPLRFKVDSYAIARSMIFLIDQLRLACRAENIGLTLERHSSFAHLILEWSGAPLHMEALQAWSSHNVMSDRMGSSVTLLDVIERHSAAIWPRAPAAAGGPSLYLVLPLSDTDASETAVAPVGGPAGIDFDFRLPGRSGAAAQEDLDGVPLTELGYTVIDTETTGLDPSAGDEIIAIGAIRIFNGRILRQEMFDTLVNPRRPISEQSMAIHGISQDMLRGQPTIEQVLPHLHRFVQDTVIVGHDAAFDLRFFELKERISGVRFSNPVLDTLLLDSVVSPNQEDRRLESICKRLGVTASGRHTALGDSLITAEIFLAMIPLLSERGIATLGEARKACLRSRFANRRY
jgi:DNA polymerase-3 subunit epsilon